MERREEKILSLFFKVGLAFKNGKCREKKKEMKKKKKQKEEQEKKKKRKKKKKYL